MTRGIEVLARAGVPSPDVDVELLVAHVLDASRGEVQARTIVGSSVPRAQAITIEELLERRAAREPLQHITGRAFFRDLELMVGRGVFVPRPETEQVAQLAIDALRAAGPGAVAVDLCTGSGALALALATEVPDAAVAAVELDAHAFVWARLNARRIGVPGLRLVCADLAEALPELDGGVDVVVANPPYIPVGAVPRDPEVRMHDPERALYGGEDGLDVVRAVSVRALALLRPGGVLVVEHGEQQGARLRALLAADGWRDAATHPDLGGRDRATVARRP
ncbi:MAG: peptide chain release factor N(5)-glutamine methyltransferase [Microbacteriaceae bacterium]